MRYRRAITVVLLIGGICGLAYAALAVYVHRTSDRSLKLAAWRLQGGEAVAARAALKWLLWFEPRHPAALHLAGLSYLRQQDLPAAVAHLERVGEDSPVYEEAQSTLAAALLADRQLERAESVLTRHLARFPTSLAAARMLSGLLLTELRQRDAVAVLEAFVGRPEFDALPLSDRVTMLYDLSTAEFHPPQAASCLPALREALERHPDQPNVRLALGQCHWDAGDSSNALLLVRESHQQRPHDHRMRLVYCEFLIETGDLASAEAALSGDSRSAASPERNPLEQDDRFWELQARIAEQKGEHDRALQHIDRAAAIQPAHKGHLSRKARLLQRLDRADDARTAYALSHELARAELDLWNLAQNLGARAPGAAECEFAAQRYESLGKSLEAAAWRRLAAQIDVETSSDPPQ